jgi:hypothetical protein
MAGGAGLSRHHPTVNVPAVPELAATHRSKRDRLRLFYARWLTLALGLTALANLVISFFVPLGAQSIRFHEDGSLTALAHVEQDSVDYRYAFYLELDDATDGGVLFVPNGSFVIPELAEGFADFEVIERDYDPTGPLPDGIVIGPKLGLVETDDEGGLLAYSIVGGGDDTWWVAETVDGIVVVPESAAPVPAFDS